MRTNDCQSDLLLATCTSKLRTTQKPDHERDCLNLGMLFHCRILTTVWVDGLSPADYFSILKNMGPRQNIHYSQVVLNYCESLTAEEAQAQLLRIVEMGVECSLSQLLQTGVMHADPHPGNIMLGIDGSIIYLDFGLMMRVPPSSSEVCHKRCC